MSEFARKLLDELLGPDRNKPLSLKGTGGVKYHDESVCRNFLVDFCPYELFANTKSDMGACPKRFHEESIKEKFQNSASPREKEEFEKEFYQFIDKLVGELERKLRRGRDRVDTTRPNDPSVAANPITDEIEEKRTLLELQIREKLSQVEKFTEVGKIVEAQDLLNQIEAIREEVEKLVLLQSDSNFRLEKKMEVCQTCGAFLIIGDAQKRIESHYEGKQHNGWARVRAALDDMKRKYGPLSARSSFSDSASARYHDSYVPVEPEPKYYDYRSRGDRDRDRRSYNDSRRHESERRRSPRRRY